MKTWTVEINDGGTRVLTQVKAKDRKRALEVARFNWPDDQLRILGTQNLSGLTLSQWKLLDKLMDREREWGFAFFQEGDDYRSVKALESKGCIKVLQRKVKIMVSVQ